MTKYYVTEKFQAKFKASCQSLHTFLKVGYNGIEKGIKGENSLSFTQGLACRLDDFFDRLSCIREEGKPANKKIFIHYTKKLSIGATSTQYLLDEIYEKVLNNKNLMTFLSDNILSLKNLVEECCGQELFGTIYTVLDKLRDKPIKLN